MSSVGEHKRRAGANRELADAFEVSFSGTPEWAVVIRFYSALHFLDAYLSLKGVAVQAHADRHNMIRRYPELSSGHGRMFWTTYKWLQDKSEQVRYDAGYALPPDSLAASKTKLKKVESFFASKLASC